MPRSSILIPLLFALAVGGSLHAEAQPEVSPGPAPKPAATTASRPWVRVTYIIDTDGKKESHYLVGQVDPQVLEKMDAGGEGVAFVRLDQACYYGYDDDGNVGSVIPHARDNATGPVYIATHTIESIELQKLDPDAYIKSIEDASAKAKTKK